MLSFTEEDGEEVEASAAQPAASADADNRRHKSFR